MKSRLMLALGAAGSLLLALLLFVIGQRDRARAKVKEVRVQSATMEANREVDAAVERERAAARQNTEETRREHEDRPADRRPDGVFRR